MGPFSLTFSFGLFVKYKLYKYGIPFQVLLKGGPYGSYVQLGEDRKGYQPKRASLSQVSSFYVYYGTSNVAS